MNTLGKILIGVNLLFSLITGALIILVFITRTHWKEGYESLGRELVKERDSRISEREGRQRLEKDLNLQLADAKTKTEDVSKDRDLLKDKTADLEKRLVASNQELAKSQNSLKQLQATIKDRETEVEELDKRNKSLIASNTKLIDDFKEATKKKIEFQIAFESAKERNGNLMDQYQELLKQFEAYRLGDGARMRANLVKNPPPEDIKGSIKAVADKDGLVTINLGSDSGLARDHTLEVYRLKPSPQYVGMVRILDVRPNEAVGKLTLRRGTVQVGDEVASEIVSKR